MEEKYCYGQFIPEWHHTLAIGRVEFDSQKEKLEGLINRLIQSPFPMVLAFIDPKDGNFMVVFCCGSDGKGFKKTFDSRDHQ